MKNRRGSALLLAMVMSAIMLTLAVFLLKMVYNGYATVSYLVMREKSFWLAEAGLAAGKVKMVHDPGWYTDIPHYPEDDVRWVKQEAVGLWESLEKAVTSWSERRTEVGSMRWGRGEGRRWF